MDITTNQDNSALSVSLAAPLFLSSRSTHCNVVTNENQVTVYSGLENGNVAVTSIENNDTSIKQLELGQASPISCIAKNPYTGSLFIAYEDGLLLRYHNETHQDWFRPEHGCLAICSHGTHQILATSTQPIHSLSLYDETNQCVLSIPHPHAPHHLSSISVNPLNDNEVVCGSSDGQVIGYDLRNYTAPVFMYQAHSEYISDVHYVKDPVPSILSCSLDGSVYQRSFTGEGRVVISNMGCIAACTIDPLLGFIAAGGQSGTVVIAHPI